MNRVLPTRGGEKCAPDAALTIFQIVSKEVFLEVDRTEVLKRFCYFYI